MKVLATLAICGLAAGVVYMSWRDSSQPLHDSINPPGQAPADGIRPVPGKRMTIVSFYADWCPACRKWAPYLEAAQRDPRCADIGIRFVDIGDFDSKLAEREGITSVPTFRILDEQGDVIATGASARDRVVAEIERRVR